MIASSPTLKKKGEQMENMNKASKRLLMIITTIVMIAGCIYAGQAEYNDDILSGMSAEKYQYIHDSLGCHTSQEDVVKEYIANQKYYDSKFY